MPSIQATWLPQGGLLFWDPDGAPAAGLARELPLLPVAEPSRLHLAGPRGRQEVVGVVAPIEQALRALLSADGRAGASDSLRCWALASRMAVDLATRYRVAPTVAEGQARWRAVLTRREDRHRFDTLARALPPIARVTHSRLLPGPTALQGFLDAAMDSLYRRGFRPGPARGWPRALAEALSSGDPSFSPRDARFVGVPEMLEAWSTDTREGGLRVGFSLRVPEGDEEHFLLEPWLQPVDHPEPRFDIDVAWAAGAKIERGERSWPHPAWTALRDLARASRIHRPLEACLGGERPRSIRLDPHEVWDLLSEGVAPLVDAGFTVEVPEDLAETGTHRIRARMRIGLGEPPSGDIGLPDHLPYRWEVVLGDQIVDGDTFAELTERREPVVFYRGAWILLDPAELARLPEGLPGTGELAAPLALRAVLTGTHQGVPVVADDRLALLIRALRDPPAEAVPPSLQGTLRPYQARGYAWLSTLGRLRLGSLLADDMGLGKTIQVIAHLLGRREQGETPLPSLVVCPTSLLLNWQHELARFAPSLSVVRYHGTTRDPADLRGSDVVLTTYGLLVRDADVLADLPWDVVALDEAQAIKNPDAKRAQAARTLDARHRIALTGTPIENRLEELWSLLQFLAPGLLGPRATFRREVAIPVERFGDQAAAEALQQTLAPFLLRRTKSDPTILPDLPEKIERRLYCTLSEEQRALYEQVVEEGLSAVAGAEGGMARRGRVLAMLTALKQVCNHPSHYLGDAGPFPERSGKLDALSDLLDAIRDGEERALVFTQYRKMGDRLQAHLANLGIEAPFLHGGVSADGRAAMVDRFQQRADGPLVFLVSLRAGGTGLNLTRASHVVHFDRWWNPAVEDQATDRAHRIGQRSDVVVHKLVTEGTLEERIDTLLEEKRSLAQQVVGSAEEWVTELDDASLRRLVTLAAEESS